MKIHDLKLKTLTFYSNNKIVFFVLVLKNCYMLSLKRNMFVLTKCFKQKYFTY